MELNSTTVAAVVTILGALFAGIGKLIRQSQKIAETNKKQDKKLDRIEILVDGRYGDVLQELADLKRLFAENTGKKADMEKADHAQKKADEQTARVGLLKPRDE